MRKGFTLVELSIVLVIIGLLIGGILVARSMISASKIAATVSQIQQFDAGVETFKSQYKYLPGDAPGGGDGDGVLEMTAASGNDDNVAAFACEIADFWNNIDQEQFPGGVVCNSSGPGAKANISGPNKNVPESKMGKSGSFVVASAIPDAPLSYLADKVNRRNFYAILDSSELQATVNFYGSIWYYFVGTTSSNSAVKPSDLLALDVKMDDGLANSGNILSGNIQDLGLGQHVGTIYTDPLNTCSSGATYLVNNTGYECTPLIRIGAQVGDPQ